MNGCLLKQKKKLKKSLKRERDWTWKESTFTIESAARDICSCGLASLISQNVSTVSDKGSAVLYRVIYAPAFILYSVFASSKSTLLITAKLLQVARHGVWICLGCPNIFLIVIQNALYLISLKINHTYNR